MDYLTLCRLVRQRGGMSGAGPSSIEGQSGEMARVVDWVRQAWLDIQSVRPDWGPLWRPLEIALEAGQGEVAAPDDFAHPATDLFRFDGGRLGWQTWPEMARNPDTEASRPTRIARRPDGRLVVWPRPEHAGTLFGEYWARPQVLTEGSDEPWLAEHLQAAIIYQALMYYAAYEDAPEIYQDSQLKLQQHLQRMTNELIPQPSMGEPLA